MNPLFPSSPDQAGLFPYMEFLPYPFLVAENREGVIHHVFLNRRFSDEIGYTLQDIPTIEEWFSLAYPEPAYRQSIRSQWFNEIAIERERQQDFISMRAEISTKNQTKCWYEIKYYEINNIHLVIFVNIQATVEKEQQMQQEMANRDRMLSILGHDLRSPIQSLNGMTNLLLQHKITQEQFMAMLPLLQEKAFRVMELLETTLQWTRSNFDSMHIRHESFALRGLVAEILLQYRESINRKRLNIRVEIARQENRTTDRDILRVVLRNLVSNAVKFTPEGGTITLRATPGIIEVADTGIGMDQAALDRLNSREYASHQGTAHESGLGIGLKLILDLLEKTGGKLAVASTPGQGTTFTVSL